MPHLMGPAIPPVPGHGPSRRTGPGCGGTIRYRRFAIQHEVAMLDRPAMHEPSLPSDRTATASALDRLTAGIGGDAIWLMARCFIGGIFVYSGFGKLTGLEGFAASLAKNGVPMADVMGGPGAAVQLFGGVG